MTRWGVGPKWGGATLVYAVLVVVAERIRPGLADFPSSWHIVWLTAGGVLLMLSAVAYIVALRELNRGLRNSALVTEGPYAVVRHPIYAAIILLLLPGVALAFESGLLLTVPVVAYLSFRAFIGKEDRRVERRFGAAYREYRARTPELFPRAFPRHAPGRKKANIAGSLTPDQGGTR